MSEAPVEPEEEYNKDDETPLEVKIIKEPEIIKEVGEESDEYIDLAITQEDIDAD